MDVDTSLRLPLNSKVIFRRAFKSIAPVRQTDFRPLYPTRWNGTKRHACHTRQHFAHCGRLRMVAVAKITSRKTHLHSQTSRDTGEPFATHSGTRSPKASSEATLNNGWKTKINYQLQQALRLRTDPKAFNRRLPANLVRCDQRPALKQKRQHICELRILG